MTIETVHLKLIPFSPDHLLTLIEDGEHFEERMGLRLADGLRDFFASDDVSPLWLAQLRASAGAEADPWVYGFAIVHKESGLVIGTVGFKGPPDNEGMVEIAYGIVPAFQSRGYATEAAEAATGFAFDHQEVSLVRAHTLPTNTASTQVLTKCGFEQMGEVLDPEDGRVWRWERIRESK